MFFKSTGINAFVCNDRVEHSAQEVGIAAGLNEVMRISHFGGSSNARIKHHDFATALLEALEALRNVGCSHETPIRFERVGSHDEQVLTAIQIWNGYAQAGAEHRGPRELFRHLIDRAGGEYIACLQRLHQDVGVHRDGYIMNAGITPLPRCYRVV